VKRAGGRAGAGRPVRPDGPNFGKDRRPIVYLVGAVAGRDMKVLDRSSSHWKGLGQAPDLVKADEPVIVLAPEHAAGVLAREQHAPRQVVHPLAPGPEPDQLAKLIAKARADLFERLHGSVCLGLGQRERANVSIQVRVLGKIVDPGTDSDLV